MQKVQNSMTSKAANNWKTPVILDLCDHLAACMVQMDATEAMKDNLRCVKDHVRELEAQLALEPAPVTPAEAARALTGHGDEVLLEPSVIIGEHLKNYGYGVPISAIRAAIRALADAGEAG